MLCHFLASACHSSAIQDGTETRKTFLHVPSAIEAEEASEAMELLEVPADRMGDGGLAGTSSAEEEKHLRRVGIIHPNNKLVQSLTTSAFQTSLARVEPSASHVSQTLQFNRFALSR